MKHLPHRIDFGLFALFILGALLGCPPPATSTDGNIETENDAGHHADASQTDAAEVVWPPPFVPSSGVTLTIDPQLSVEAGDCAYQCSPADRVELPRVLDLCELGGADSSVSGACVNVDECSGLEEVCTADEFEFMTAYCALDGLPQAYCGAYVFPAGYLAVSARITHRLVGAQLIVRLRPTATTPELQVFLQEGNDEIDDQGRPDPIPLLLEAASGTVTISSSDLAGGNTLSGSYTLSFVSPYQPPVERTITGHFTHQIIDNNP